MSVGCVLVVLACGEIPFGSNTGVVLPPNHTATQALLVDIDGDGHLDAVCPGRNTTGVLRVAMGTGTAPAFTAPIDVQLERPAEWVQRRPGGASADLVVALRGLSGRGVVLSRDADGGWSTHDQFAAYRDPRCIALIDVTHDGLMDALVANSSDPSVSVHGGAAAGGFSTGTRFRPDDWYGGTGSLQQIEPCDVDLDGDDDVVGASISSGSILVWRHRSGTLARWPVHYPIQPLGADSPALTTFALADMDADGDLDVVAQLLSTELMQPVVICWNDGGAFSRQSYFSGPTTGYGWTCAAADLDGDGDHDIVTSTVVLNGGLFLLENTGSRTQPALAGPVLKRLGPFFRHITLVDTDHDCDRDIVSVDISSNALVNLPNLGGCGGLAGGPRGRQSDVGSAQDDALGARPLTQSRHTHPKRDAARTLARALADWGIASQDPTTARGIHDTTSSDSPPAEGGLAGDSCGPQGGTAGACDEPHATPGCYTTACCQAVCAIAPQCCVVSWDEACVAIGVTECNGIYCPAIGPCDQAHETGGCEDAACCERTTALDGWCGEGIWDEPCALEAASWCAFTPCAIDGRPGARSEGEWCYDHTNDGCTMPVPAFDAIACGDLIDGRCTTGAPRDTDWFALPEGGAITLELVSEFPASLAIVRGSCLVSLEQTEWIITRPCEPAAVTVCVPPGELWWAIVSVGGVDGPIQSGQPCTDPDPDNPPNPDDPPIVPGEFGTRYQLAASCAACRAIGDLDGDGLVNGADLGGLLSAWGSVGNALPADLNDDGIVEGADLGLMLTQWS